MKISKELKTGLIAIVAIGVLVAGVNFLKGNSFFGGDDVYFAYFPNSGELAPASAVTLNGVGVGKVLSVDYQPNGTPEEKVMVSFNIQNKDVKIPVGSVVEIGTIGFFNKGLLLKFNSDLSGGIHKPGDKINGVLAQDMVSQIQGYADPIIDKMAKIMISVDEMVKKVSSFWDTTANSELEEGMQELKVAIKRLGNVAKEVESLVSEEKVKFGRILSNVESITFNLKESNEKVAKIIGNTQKITDDLVTADFKSVIGDAQNTLQQMNLLLAKANTEDGTLNKLLTDDQLYNNLVQTNKALNILVEDLTLHPERYIHFSVLGAKTKGAPLNASEERKLRKLLDTIPD
ncbi:MAG: phospholipid/cholesterol/gamma-HCH transport system substrate-binding protein [Psychromonas sp.]